MFSDALELTLEFEGGYANHPADPGGETNKGITFRVYDAYRKSKNLPPQSVKLITQDEVNDIYLNNYWKPSKAEVIAQTHPKTATIHFDTAVNCGVGTAVRCLQRALGVKLVDGVIGPITFNALTNASDTQLACLYAIHRMRYYNDISLANPKLATFLTSWTYRVRSLVKSFVND